MVRQVAGKVDGSGYRPSTVVGLARGGWVPARLMCDFLGITDLISLKVEHWLETGKTKDEATIRYPLTTDLRDKEIIVVDDITDTGKSLISSTEYLMKFKPKAMKTATMQYILSSKFKPDYYGEEVKVWTWFIYPWNWIEDTSTLVVRLLGTRKEEAWTHAEIGLGLKEFFEISWDRKMLTHILRIMVEREQLSKAAGDYRLREAKVVHL